MSLKSQLAGWSKKDLESLAAGAGIATRDARTKEKLIETIVRKGEAEAVILAVRSAGTARMREFATRIPEGAGKNSRAAVRQALDVIRSDFALKTARIVRELESVAEICEKRKVDAGELREACRRISEVRERSGSLDIRPLVDGTRFVGGFVLRNLDVLHDEAPLILASIEEAKSVLIDTKGLKVLEQSITATFERGDFETLPRLLRVLETRVGGENAGAAAPAV